MDHRTVHRFVMSDEEKRPATDVPVCDEALVGCLCSLEYRDSYFAIRLCSALIRFGFGLLVPGDESPIISLPTERFKELCAGGGLGGGGGAY